ncbi:MAG: glycoside hydrolase family protein [Armatimonadota bacterium]
MNNLITKIGTIDCDIVETTPIVFKDRLFRFEYIRYPQYLPNQTGDSYFRFVDVESGEISPAFATGWHLGNAYSDESGVYAFGVNQWGGNTIQCFRSDDMQKWESYPAIELPGWGFFNTSVCKADGTYVMAIEIDAPPEETGVRFTIRFAVSDNLIDWKLTPSECVFSKDRYTACPVIRYINGLYYMIYLEEKPGPSYVPYIVRSANLVEWEASPCNPVLVYSDEDKIIADPRLTCDQRERISNAVNINNSDVDICEFNGQTHIYYSWGDQQGKEFLAYAVYDGTLIDFLEGYFPF